MTWVLIAVGAAVGAPLRYLVDRAVQQRRETELPWGTFAVNVAGTFVLGFVIGLPDVRPEVVAAIGTGFCGALTTFSALSWEELVLAERGRYASALSFLLISVSWGLAAAFLGWSLAVAVT